MTYRRNLSWSEERTYAHHKFSVASHCRGLTELQRNVKRGGNVIEGIYMFPETKTNALKVQ